MSYKDLLAVETGRLIRQNLWLEWVRYTACSASRTTGCIVCAGTRLHLGTVQLEVPKDDLECVIGMHTNKSTTNCSDYAPLLNTKPSKPPADVVIYKGNYTCVQNSGGGETNGKFEPGTLPQNHNSPLCNPSLLINQSFGLYDIFWICADMKIRSVLPLAWTGPCTLAKTIMPFTVIPYDPPGHNVAKRERRKFWEASTPQVYVDAIEVPREVPNEFKARDQMAAGFESIFLFITVNKNVDWINYLHFNQQRFVNYTRDALSELAEQLGPTAKIVLQNRLALDMLLAEKGGVCGMFR
ncbi:hypothetical protein PRIEUP_LOCUS16365 [Pristimantis euphronides]